MNPNSDTQRLLNREHAKSPQIGDYWHERFVPILVIVSRSDTNLVVCKTRRDLKDRESWTWELSKLERMTIDELEKYVKYSTMDEYWCDVVLGAHQWVEDYVDKSLVNSVMNSVKSEVSEANKYDGIELKSRWKHTNGNIYTVIMFTNMDSENEKYVPTVVYQGENGKTWSRPISDWKRSMTLHQE
jgi:hypothetical protein